VIISCDFANSFEVDHISDCFRQLHSATMLRIPTQLYVKSWRIGLLRLTLQL
jgi:hypothetical protein